MTDNRENQTLSQIVISNMTSSKYKEMKNNVSSVLGMNVRNASLMIGYLTVLGGAIMMMLDTTHIEFERSSFVSLSVKDFYIGMNLKI